MTYESWSQQLISEWVHKGKTFITVAETEKTYSKQTYTKFMNRNLVNVSLIEFGKFLEMHEAKKKEHTSGSSAMMVTVATTDNDCEDCTIAILDTGCNNTFHGSKWMERFMKPTGYFIPLQQSGGKFSGVGGQVQVKGKREIPRFPCLSSCLLVTS